MQNPQEILKRGIGVLVVLVVPVAAAIAGSNPAVDMALKAHYGDASAYRYATADLNDDGVPDAVVLFTDPEWCGSGGCTMVILRGTKDGFVFVSSSTVTRQPVRVLEDTKHGWRTLSVWIAGGGVEPAQVLMRFNGQCYPGNPTTQPRATAADLDDASTLEFKH